MADTYSTHATWHEGHCTTCGAEACACSSATKDYYYFCTNPNCKNYKGEDRYDQDELPRWLTKTKEKVMTEPKEQNLIFRKVRLEGDGTIQGTSVIDAVTDKIIGNVAQVVLSFNAEAGERTFPIGYLKLITNLPINAEDSAEDWMPEFIEEPITVVCWDVVGAYGVGVDRS